MSTATTQAADLKAFCQRFAEEFWNGRDYATADQYVDSGFKRVEIGTGVEVAGPEGLKQTATAWQGAFPDMHLTLGEMIAEGNNIMVAWSFTGTNNGPMNDIAATGRKVIVSGVSILTVSKGKITREVVYPDLFGMMQQLGVIPK